MCEGNIIFRCVIEIYKEIKNKGLRCLGKILLKCSEFWILRKLLLYCREFFLIKYVDLVVFVWIDRFYVGELRVWIKLLNIFCVFFLLSDK